MLSTYTILKCKRELDDFQIFVELKLRISWYFQNSLISFINFPVSFFLTNTFRTKGGFGFQAMCRAYTPPLASSTCPCVNFTSSTAIFYKGVPGFTTGCPCGVWCRGLTTWLLYGSLFYTWFWMTVVFYVWQSGVYFRWFCFCSYIVPV